ncbi:hypothetical protein RRG08_066527 [Elysia crispata]|uniref:Uncharacterized protein n=1 Tax=Elysia crispata TaxID=231223 RepID=A0AAE0ZM43_9GAST|nr:hypothetical protein RRG08_066527 [Elysia crispata]
MEITTGKKDGDKDGYATGATVAQDGKSYTWLVLANGKIYIQSLNLSLRFAQILCRTLRRLKTQRTFCSGSPATQEGWSRGL